MAMSQLVSRLFRRPPPGPTSKITLAVVRVPADTPSSDTLTLGANVNGWRPDAPGAAFTRGTDGTWRLTVEIATGSTLEFKVTRGSWNAVERDVSGRDISNRTVVGRGDETVKVRVSSWADRVGHTLSGDVETIENVYSPQLGNARRIWVCLPPSYRKNPDKRYPVLYMHDGQNLFDAATSFSGEWGADESAANLAKKKGLEAILVGIDNNADRLKEYAPFPAAENDGVALADRYSEFLVQTVKPMIDGRYRTQAERSRTGILGSSMGGLISLYTALAHPDTFGYVGAMSPSFWFADFQMYEWTKHHTAPPMKIYLDVGTAEEGESPAGTDEFVVDTQEMGDLLKQEGHLVRMVVAKGANHSEEAWKKRFPGALEWFLVP